MLTRAATGILAKNPSFDVEHIRDTFRFKAVSDEYEVSSSTFNFYRLAFPLPRSFIRSEMQSSSCLHYITTSTFALTACARVTSQS
jgi:hypothetical protein